MNRFLFNRQNSGRRVLLLISFYILLVAVYFGSFTTYSNYVILPICLLWLPSIYSSYHNLENEDRKYIVLSIIYLSVIILYYILGLSKLDRGVLLRHIVWIMTGLIAISLMNSFSNKELNKVYLVFSIIIIVLLFVYIRFGRRLAALEGFDEASTIANAHFSSMFMLISGVCTIAIVHIKKILLRLLFVFVLLLSLYLNLFILQRGTNVIFTIALIAIILLFCLKSRSIIYLSSALIGFVLIYMVSAGLVIDFFEWMAEVVPSPRLAQRFEEIAQAMYYEDINAGSGSLSARSRLMGTSWDTFTSSLPHLLFGVGEHPANNNIIGNHSHILDTLASFGLIGAWLTISFFSKQYKIMMKVLDKKSNWDLYMQCAIVFAFYVARNFYGKLTTPEMNLMIMIYFPMTFKVILHYKQKQEKLQIQLL